MPLRSFESRGFAAILCLVAFLCGFMPASAENLPGQDVNNAHILALMNSQSCVKDEARQFENYVAQVTAPGQSPTPSPTPFGAIATPTPFNFGATPTPIPTPSFPPSQNHTATLYATPRPYGSGTPSPPPIPTATPSVSPENAPVFVQRGGDTPPPITPAGHTPPSPTPEPTGVPTLAPNYIAVLGDQVTGSTTQGQPGDAIGNVHILYGQEEIVGQRAHFDGIRTITITGDPFIYDHANNSVLIGDEILFDTIDQTAKFVNGAGTSAQGVQRGLVHFTAKDMHTDPDGVAHGLAPTVTTCENARGGYHISGRNMEVIPGDKIIIYKAILWLGAAAIFYLPKVVIPLRTVETPAQRQKYFPDVGYDSYEGAWIKTQIGFGRDQYYYGYYRVDYFTKVGLGLGYVGFYQKRNGRRSANLNFYGIRDKRTDTTTYNLNAQEIENISQTLRGNFNIGYQSNYGPYTNVPSNTNINAALVHQTQRTSQNYSFTRSAVGSQSSSDTFAFTDNRQITNNLSQAINFNDSSSQSSYGGFSSSSSTAQFNSLTHWTTAGADYQLTYDKNYTQQPYGIDRVPELQIRPTDFFKNFPVLPLSAQFTAGEYSEPSNAFSTSRANLAFVAGPLIAKVLGSDFQGTVNVQQNYYGTGDEKASIQQNLSLTTPVGSHIVNAITYNEANYNGPALVPFQYIDQQPTSNTKNGQDLLRFFNGNIYTLALGFSTNFDRMAQPVSYQLTMAPSPRSVVLVGGSFLPGPGNGFPSTNLQFSTPFGRDTQIQFIGDLDWKEKGRIENKIIYWTKTIGDCYQLQLLYNESQKSISATINLLAFPNQGASFNLTQSAPVVPSTFNF